MEKEWSPSCPSPVVILDFNTKPAILEEPQRRYNGRTGMGSDQDNMDTTLGYYASHAAEYAERTEAIDVSPLYAQFVPLLKPGSVVLDLGCGGGRDARHFAQLGHNVIGVDPCLPLLREAARRTSGDLRHRISLMAGAAPKLPLKDRCCSAIWACASLLHLPRSKMSRALVECSRILVPGGVFFLTVKRGTGEAFDGQRWFTYWQMDDVRVVFADRFEVLAAEESSSRSQSGVTWLHVLGRKSRMAG